MGGELIQHVDDHMKSELFNDTAHTVDIESDSRLASIVGTTSLEVNSLHHQVVAVAMGGELLQHVDDHMQSDLFIETAHTVDI